MTKWIYLSPHFDDVVLSAGGMVWEQTKRDDQVEIWTICGGDPPSDKPLTDYAKALHTLWRFDVEVPLARSKEDTACCRILGAGYRRYTIPDNIYRYFPGAHDAVVQAPEDNFGALEPAEAYLIPLVADFLRKNVPDGWEVVAPLTVGNHRDHALTRRAAEQLGFPLWHYADYPYFPAQGDNLADWIPPDAQKYTVDITPVGLKIWQDGVASHRSQIILFWQNESEMRTSIENYFKAGYGCTLWKF